MTKLTSPERITAIQMLEMMHKSSSGTNDAVTKRAHRLARRHGFTEHHIDGVGFFYDPAEVRPASLGKPLHKAA